METSLNGKGALVCGSTQGIGKAAAVELALLGATVTLIARDEAKLREVAAGLPAPTGQKHDWVAADFSRPEDVAAAVQRVPPEPVHILVNNTGGPKGGPAHAAGAAEFEAAFRMHVVSSQLLVQALLPGMKAEKYGRIINVISTSVKAPIPDLGVSNTIRAAVANWAKTLAWELGPFGITVNNVLPGFTDTARLEQLFKAKAEKTGKTLEQVREEAVATIPARRLGRPEETAAAIAFLATPAAAYINGTNVVVDGGRTPSL
jgi:3-oxoacyl-[acyl-carrier protein] reductase